MSDDLAKRLNELAHRNADDWLKQPEFAGVEVLDPDGWRREGRSWYDSISREEFEMRLIDSTCKLPRGYLDRYK